MILSKLTPLFLLTFLSFSGFAQDDCVLKKDADSIKVYTCAAALKFKTIKAIFTVDTELSRLAAFVLDIENYTHWQYNTIQARIVKRNNEQEMIYYTEIAAPWPVNNRDMVTRLQISQDPTTKVVTVDTRNFPGLIPAVENIVRVPMSHGVWVVTPISITRLKVEYVIQIDPGGSVPAWMVNMVAAQAPYDSFKNLRNKIHSYKIKNAISFIVD